MTTIDKPNKVDDKVLFVCSSNVNRSQIAEALFNYLTGTNRADSAGIDVNRKYPELETVRQVEENTAKSSFVAESLATRGIEVDTSQLLRQQLTPEMIPLYKLVVHFVSPEKRPDWLGGGNVIFWDVFDPHARSLDAVLQALNEIEPRVEKLIELDKSGGDFRELDDDDIDAEANRVAR